jgi:cytoskeletal protein CcmA (bactofilin family)
MSKARELAELSRTVSDSADATAITINSDEEVTFASGVTVTGALSATGTSVFASLDISGDIDVDGTTNLDIVDIDGAVDMASTLAVGGVVTANAGVVVDNFTLDGTTLALSSGDMTLDVAGDINLDSDSGYVLFKDAGTEHARIYQNN